MTGPCNRRDPCVVEGVCAWAMEGRGTVRCSLRWVIRGVVFVSFLSLAAMSVVHCDRSERARVSSTESAVPVVRCMVYRPCGCVEGCAGISVPAESLRPGMLVPIVAGQGCGRRARVETALGIDGQPTLVLGAAEECERRCGGMTALHPVEPEVCTGRCDACPSGMK